MPTSTKTTKTPKKQKTNSDLIGSRAVPTTPDSTTKIDIDIDKKLIDSIIQAGTTGGLNSSDLENFTTFAGSRDQMYQLIDTMAQDSTVSAIIRTYAEAVCEVSDNGHIVWCESNDPRISKFVNYLLNIMNVDKNIFSWTFNLIKYGDVYLRLYRESDYVDPFFKRTAVTNFENANTNGSRLLSEEVIKSEKSILNEDLILNIHTSADRYSYYIEMVNDPGSMFELTKFGKTYGYIEVPINDTNFDVLQNYATNINQTNFTYRMRSDHVNIFQADDFVHASLDDNIARYPEKVSILTSTDDNDASAYTYTVRRGKSMLQDSYKIWREKSLLENSVILNRITKSSVVRNIQVEVGDMNKTQVQNTLRRVKNLFEQKSAFNVGTSLSEYNNPGPIENNIYTAVHNGQGAITINSVGGDVDVKNIADLDWWNNKFYSSYGIPKQWFGWTDDATGFNGGTSLTVLSSVFGKGVKRVQNAMLQALTDAINLYCLNIGAKSYLNNFVLKMKTPLTQEEKDYRANLSDRISAISSFQSLLSDVENKVRRLEILKTLVKTLNYDDNIIQELDDEIEAARAAAKQEAEAQQNPDTDTDQNSAEAPKEASDEDLGTPENVLGGLGLDALADIKEQTESNAPEAERLVEENSNSSPSDDLPTPEELGKDFTKNN